jgi:hypothetical protein
MMSQENRKKSLYNITLRKTNVKHFKTTCRFDIDIEPGSTESSVEFNSKPCRLVRNVNVAFSSYSLVTTTLANTVHNFFKYVS